ncbi:MAG: hypothetical protein AAGJ34_01660 [Pseudomonadota bacterium]
MNMTRSICLCIVVGLGAPTVAQEFDPNTFEDALNTVLTNMEGVSVEMETGGIATMATDVLSTSIYDAWAIEAAGNTPTFAFIVEDIDGNPVEVFGSDVPFSQSSDGVVIPGMTLEPGETIRTVGSAGYIDAITEIKLQSLQRAPARDIARALRTITDASDYIAAQLCPMRSRPSELVLNLSAGFELVFDVQTGSQVTWNLEEVCERFE